MMNRRICKNQCDCSSGRQTTGVNLYIHNGYIFIMCDSRKYPYPPTDGQWKFLGGGGAKRQKFPRGMGGWPREKFPGGINVGNRTTQTYGRYFDLQCPKTLKQAFLLKRNSRCLLQMSFSLLRIRFHPLDDGQSLHFHSPCTRDKSRWLTVANQYPDPYRVSIHEVTTSSQRILGRFEIVFSFLSNLLLFEYKLSQKTLYQD